MKKDLMFSCMGNGVTVCDRLHHEHGDYQKVAHINAQRKVKYYIDLTEEYKKEIEGYANNENPSISITQNQKVFY